MSKQKNGPGKKYPVQFSENDDPLDIRYDDVFKAVFTRDTPESKGAISHLISALINKTVTVQTILANEPPEESRTDRKIRFDINCKTEAGQLVNVEMFLHPRLYEKVRLEYLSARLFGRQEIQGTDRDYPDLKESYQISILANNRYFDNDHLVHTFEYYDSEHQVSLGGRSRIITLELSKAKSVITKPVEEIAPEEAWAAYFEYLTDRGKRGIINEIIQHEEGIAMASTVLIEITPSEREAAWRESRLKYELDYKADMNIARREGEFAGMQKGIAAGRLEGESAGIQKGMQQGRQEGLLQGHTEGLVETARNALVEGLPVEVVRKITGLDLEMIQTLQANIQG